MIIALAEKLYTVRCQKNGKYSEIDISLIYFKQHCETLLAQ